ncbi:uncharacterized protein LOC112503500 [Cynara cardunculus var. scolymus]|uniref:uncharacterized protein LOC112503500 n=1 Tax=Cynara cardunculus var. scolymus TaxID=59895 RepID=UPI000D62341C|nr:uncharacterized protein LOC112503500 [Cynara cardunculus var. scolymus]
MLMVITKSILFVTVITNLSAFSVSQRSGEIPFSSCNENANFTINSVYQTNLDEALSSVITHDPNNTYGFYNRSVGNTPNQVNVIALCRGDVEQDECHRCIRNCSSTLRALCPNQKGAIFTYERCMLRYSDETILGNRNSWEGWDLAHPQNASNMVQFNQRLDQLWEQLRSEASSGGSLRKYASNEVDGPRSSKIFGLMQCTPDLSLTECDICLSDAINRIQICCDGKRGARVVYPSCNIRYEDYRFFNATMILEQPPSAPLPPSSPLAPSGIYRNSTTIIVVVVVATVSVLLLVVVFFCVFIRRKRKLQPENLGGLVFHEDADLDEIITAESLQRSFGDIRAATDDFSENNKLGEGGFGLVYKGKLRNGQEIAVKRLSKDSGQGELEFKNEVLLLARLQHRNLVRLLGFSLEGSERLLMYEFVQNASLDQFIFDPVKRVILDWETRYKIIQGVARGLLYLHEDSRLKIIHRDMKASNILLDADMNAKIADFGMARLFKPEETQGNTNRIVGTYGYMAPEYLTHGKFSIKSDVFSFGVLVLEIVTGHKNHRLQNGMMTEDLISHVWKCWRDGTATSLIDPTLNDGSNSLCDTIRCIHIGLLCVQEDVTERPTMASVVLMLNSLSITLKVPSQPAFFMRTFMNYEKYFFEEYSSSKSDPYSLKNCIANVNFTRNSAYEINRDEAFSSVITSDPNNTYGFYNRSVGETPDKVYVLALCRGDIERDECQRCINDYGARLREFCPNQKRGNIIYDTCMIRYSNQILLGSSNIIDGWDSEDGWDAEDHENATDIDQFKQALDRLWAQLRDDASSGGSLRKYASNVTDGPRSTKIYGLMQCSPDISATTCYNCLSNAINRTRSCCDGRRGARVLYLSCNIRYQDYPFFNATVSLAPPPSAPLPPSVLPPSTLPPSGKRNNTTIIVVVIVVATVGLLILMVVFFCVFIRAKGKLEGLQPDNSVHEDMTDLDEIITAESLQCSFRDIRAATNDFSENNKLGQGGFGSVYKGKLRNGQEIAVKRLSNNSGQRELEFKNEVLLLARLQHRNLVRLLGFSLEGSERLLMYEFVQNASLDQFIFDPLKRATLDWETRYKIIQGVARGLLYLHEDSRLKIVHRDMKASNVLLDAGMNAKIADFGMARLFTHEETQGNTSRIVGTYGYMAPEYVMHGQFSVKSDVFSFGVLVLEIVTGHKNHGFQNGMEDLPSHAWKSWRDGTSTSIIDPTLNNGSNSLRDMIRCIHIALLCVQEDVMERPTMASVVLMLGSLSLTLALPSEPAFFMCTFTNFDEHFFEEYALSINDSRPSKK